MRADGADQVVDTVPGFERADEADDEIVAGYAVRRGGSARPVETGSKEVDIDAVRHDVRPLGRRPGGDQVAGERFGNGEDRVGGAEDVPLDPGRERGEGESER